MRIRSILASSLTLVVALCTLLSGCSHSDCQTTSDCGSGQSCVYPVTDGCSAKGVCEDTPSGTNCQAFVEYCGCDGSLVSVGCGFSGGSVPVEGTYTGSCGHGTKDAGGPCVVGADCGQNQDCYYPIADGCSAVGVCLENLPGPSGTACEDKPVYCGCDGGRTQTVCGGHDGYVAAPVSRAVDTVAACSSSGEPIVVPSSDAGPR
jgi:hypothetical protein